MGLCISKQQQQEKINEPAPREKEIIKRKSFPKRLSDSVKTKNIQVYNK